MPYEILLDILNKTIASHILKQTDIGLITDYDNINKLLYHRYDYNYNTYNYNHRYDYNYNNNYNTYEIDQPHNVLVATIFSNIQVIRHKDTHITKYDKVDNRLFYNILEETLIEIENEQRYRNIKPNNIVKPNHGDIKVVNKKKSKLPDSYYLEEYNNPILNFL
jgi:hypothetical protein